MTLIPHAIVWIDHAQARVLLFDRENVSTKVVHPSGGTPHVHHKANSIDSGHIREDQAYLHAVGQAMRNAAEILVAGPANEKLELMKHLARHDEALLDRVVCVQTSDHPTDGELLDHARRYFAIADRTLAQRVAGS